MVMVVMMAIETKLWLKNFQWETKKKEEKTEAEKYDTLKGIRFILFENASTNTKCRSDDDERNNEN